MHKRSTPRAIPDRPNYLIVETSLGPIDLRHPNAARALDLFGVLADVAEEDQDSFGALSLNINALGVLVGDCWHDRNLSLEADRAPLDMTTRKRRRIADPVEASDYFAEALLGYGRAVVDELTDHGFTLDDVGELGSELAARLSRPFISKKEAETAADFPSPPEGSTTSSAVK